MEYKIIEGRVSDVQKTLNQWKHMYKIKVVGQGAYDVNDQTWLVITVERTKI